MSGYVRQSSADILPTAVIRATPVNNEFNALRDAFAQSGGHKHDGTAAEGDYIPLIADSTAKDKVVIDGTNHRVGLFVNVAGTSTEQLRVQSGAVLPVTTNALDIGSSSLKIKDAYLAGNAYLTTGSLTGQLTSTLASGTAPFVIASTTKVANLNADLLDGNDWAAPAAIGTGTAAAGTFTNLTANTSLTAATAAISAGTINNSVIGGTTANAITGTIVTATTGFVGGLTGNVTGNTTGTHTGAVTGAVTGDVTGNVTASTGTSSFNDVTINGTLNMNAGTAATITNLTSPTNTGDAATKGYVDTADALKLNLSGGTMSGVIAMGTNKITGLGTPTLSADATTKTYVDTADALKLNLAGGTMSGAIAMGTNKITGLGTPTLSTDAATKTYVDTSISNLVASAPGALDTLNELAAALGNDASFSTTVTNSIATKLPLAGGTMSGAIAMGTSKITGLGDPTLAQDAATKTYVDTADALKLNLAGGTMTGAIAMGTSKITGMGNPTLAQDATTKTYVDTADALKLNLTGGTMSGVIAMGTSKITGMGDPTAAQDGATKNYVDTQDALKLSLTGGTMSGAIAMGTSKITGLGDPTLNQDAATKFYVDGILGSATSAATSASAAATSASNAATSASNASTSASNASTSASSALTYLNTFKGQYYGSLSSNPSLDPLGNAIGTGDLYWNSTSSEMRVYNGSTWVAAYLPAAGYLALTGGTMTGAITFAGAQTWPTFNQNTTGTAAGLSATLATTSGGTGLTSFTSGGVVYASSSSALATGSALTFDGSTLVSKGTTNGNIVSVGGSGGSHTGYSQFQGYTGNGDSSNINYALVGNKTGSPYLGIPNNGVGLDLVYGTSFSFCFQETEALRLTSTSLYTASGINVGIGTSSPLDKLDVVSASATYRNRIRNSGANEATLLFQNSSTGTATNDGLYLGILGSMDAYLWNYENNPIIFGTNNTQRMVLDSAGNLGLGVTPSAWDTTPYKAFQIGSGVGSASVIGRNDNVNGGGLALNAYYSSTGYKYIGSSYASLYIQSSGSHLWYTAASGTAGNAISFTQAMTLDASGNLLVGATSTIYGSRLTVSYNAVTTNGPIIVDSRAFGINRGGAQYLGGQYNTAGNYRAFGGIVGLKENATDGNSAGYLGFYTNGNAADPAERARIDSSGNVGIGTSSPSQKLSVKAGNGDQAVFDNAGERYTQVNWSNSGALKGAIWADNTNSLFEMYGHTGIGLSFYTNALERARISAAGGFSVGTTADPGAGAIYATGNITAYYSDARLKTVSGKIENALDKVAKLSGVYYTNNDVAKSFGYDSDEVQVGVLAQEVEAVMPEIVKAAPFDLDENNNSKSGEHYKTVQYEKLVPLLIEAINELQAKVKLLENK